MFLARPRLSVHFHQRKHNSSLDEWTFRSIHICFLSCWILFIKWIFVKEFSFVLREYFFHENKKYILKTKENVPYRTVPAETFRSGYWLALSLISEYIWKHFTYHFHHSSFSMNKYYFFFKVWKGFTLPWSRS